VYAIDYAARVAEELGADVVKLHEPQEPNAACPEPYRSLREDLPARLRRVVRSAGRTLVMFSGGARDDDAAVLDKARLYMEAGATGLVFGRNLWQRPFEEALALTRRIHELCARHAR
jgi:class I fructose-bisphosphate aldolase